MNQAPDGPNLGRLARGGALNLAGAVSAGVLGLALVFVVAHAYDPATAGAFFAATSLFLILGAAAGLGTDTGLLRWVPRHLALGDPAAARRTVPIALVPVAALAVTCAVVLAVLAPWLAGRLGSGEPEQVTVMLRVLAAFLPLAALQDALLAATRGHGAMRPTVAIEKVFRQFAQVGGASAAALLTDHPAALALAWALPYLPGMVAAALWYRRLATRTFATLDDVAATTTAPPPSPSLSAPSQSTPPPSAASPSAPSQSAPPQSAATPSEGGRGAIKAQAAEFWRFTSPRAVAGICQQALQRADIVLLAALASPREAALYTAATRFIVIGQLGTQAVQNVMQPAVSRHLALSDRVGAQKVFAVATTWTVLLTWPVHLTVAVGASVYLSLFGSGYSGAGQAPTVILALAMLLATAAGPLDVLLLMAGRSGLSLVNSATALAVNIALNLLLIDRYGATGAAIAWAAAIITRNLLGMVQVRRILAIGPKGAGLPLAASVALLCFGILALVIREIFGANAAGLAIGLISGMAAYGALLWFGRDRLALTAFTALLPGRRGARPPVPDDDPPRRVHARKA
ncbi:polysaccharide biosynthesis C-terminal domain-containing protein [Spirillospora sp. NPDC048911]|uniref:polysaccharide biosynthesis C-terminal domain-containing protein n=1 Tax=Spirillospora sp. NPDC048911 TaxID=3364527 RepID=UPI00371F5BCB